MPELPDVTVYLDCLRSRVVDRELQKARVRSAFLVRTYEPPLSAAEGKKVRSLRRLGKRIVFCLEDDLFLVFHLMIAGRFRWRPPGHAVPKKVGLAAFDFEEGTLLLTEAGSKKRASLSVVSGEAGLAEHDRGGLDVLESDAEAFREAVRRENHTLKRTLTDPRILSGIGNAYSDEILHHARLSPTQWTRNLDDESVERLRASTVHVLTTWIDRLREQVGDGFPEKVTAFRPEMAVHGRYRQPCPDCGAPVQRILYAQNECNYCARCQTGGKVLADRVLSRLMGKDWPRTLEDWDRIRGGD